MRNDGSDLSRLRWWERPLVWLGAFLAVALFRLLAFTLRDSRVIGAEHLETLRERPAIVATWHNRSIVSGYFVVRLLARRGVPLAAMVSLSRDGELMARVGGRLGLRVVRGSASRGGLKALRAMRRALTRERWSVGLAADGSRGPVYDLKPGTLVLAQTSGAPIVPIVGAAARYWRLSSWDRLIVPKPFSRMAFAVGEPLSIPELLTSEELAEVSSRLTETLHRLAERADQAAAG